MQLGFVIDHSRCIGCHACTVACKSENDVPLGSFRTWVKYVETGTFPQVKRHFAVLRCNQCTAAPCVTICPTVALTKRADGVVDVDPDRCIGCKSCMQACPYDALYIHPDQGTAQKCHFCVHRTERGLAPACAVVCPTEAIIPGDFDDPESRVSKLRAAGDLAARKTEAGTGPNVFYREVAPQAVEPQATSAAGGYLWANQLATAQLEAEVFDVFERRAKAGANGAGANGVGEDAAAEAPARTTYDVQHGTLWGERVSAYVFFKALAAGIFLVSLLVSLVSEEAARGTPAPFVAWAWGSALVFLGLTAVLLVADLKRPSRFWYILRHPNWDSWLTRGAVVLGLYGALLFVLFLSALDGGWDLGALLLGLTAPVAILTAIYTAWLFRQCKGRVLWMQRFLAVRFLVHALAAGAAFLMLLVPAFAVPGALVDGLRLSLAVTLVATEVLHLFDTSHAPAGRKPEYLKALRLTSHGPYAGRHWGISHVLGALVPLIVIAVTVEPAALAVAGALALVGIYNEQDVFVEAGQALPIH